MNKETILIVDDESSIRTFLRISLVGSGYQTLEADCGHGALELIRQRQPEALVLDMVLPDISGLEVVQNLRQWTWIPIIVLSVLDDPQTKIEVLDAGADDYLCKPFGVDELLARLRAALRRREAIPQNGVLIKGPLEIDQDKRTVSWSGQRVNLTPTEFSILQLLMKNIGKVLTHRQILVPVWGPAYVEEYHMLRVNIFNLRKKLEKMLPSRRLIHNEPGIGYRLLDPEDDCESPDDVSEIG